MQPDLDQFFESLRADSNRAPLAGPADLRTVGDTRVRQHRLAAVGVGALTVITIALSAAALGTTRREPAPVATQPAPVVSRSGSPTATPTPTPTTAAPDAGAHTSAPPNTLAQCRAADLDPTPRYQSDGAMGTAYQNVFVRNRTDRSCTLDTYPKVLYRDTRSGTLKTMPASHVSGSQPRVVLGPHQYATFYIAASSGCHYDPAGPECANPVTYQEVWVELGGGERYRLSNLSVYVPENQPRISPWAKSTGPTS